MSESRQLTEVEKILLGVRPDFDIDMGDVLNFGKALLTVAGADGEVSEIETLAFWEFMSAAVDIPEAVREELRNFDFINADLAPLVSEIAKGALPEATSKRLILGAVTISMADGEYHRKERAAVLELGEKLGVDWESVIKIEAIAEQMAATRKMAALFLQAI